MPDDSATERAASGFATRTRPVFDSPAEQREHDLARLAGVCRIFGKAGFSEGLLGHITMRDPEHPDRFWANPLGISFNRIKVSDLVQVDHEGNLLVGNRPVNPVGLLLHAAIHKARPDVGAVCHAHSTYGSAWSAFGQPVAPITQDLCVFHQDQAIIREPRIAMDPTQADDFAAALGGKKVGIQVGHGIFTTGGTVEEAAWWFIGMDKACHIQLLTSAVGQPERWPDPAALGVRAGLGSPDFGWLSFQTLWDEIVAEAPELLD
jgi:ribulose-5-phosphate 4-epimerase/fuculose-1-phosphate aldolase